MMQTLRRRYGVDVIHMWGMTELSPIGTSCTLQRKHLSLPPQEQQAILEKQGRVLFGVDMKIVDDGGKDQSWDGRRFGNLMVKGSWVVASYFGQAPGSQSAQGWFATGDVATISPDGYLQITDRSKDVIKSGGEWIGSIDLENIAMSHPGVLQAACIGVAHAKWDERRIGPKFVTVGIESSHIRLRVWIRVGEGAAMAGSEYPCGFQGTLGIPPS